MTFNNASYEKLPLPERMEVLKASGTPFITLSALQSIDPAIRKVVKTFFEKNKQDFVVLNDSPTKRLLISGMIKVQ